MVNNRETGIRIARAMIILVALLFGAGRADAQGLDWYQVSAHGFGDSQNWWIGSLATLEDHLYAGTWNPEGAEVWRSADGLKWNRVVRHGLDSVQNQGVVSAIPFRKDLYLGVYNTASGAAIWRSADGIDWTSVMGDGFGDASNGAIRSMAVFDDVLYAGTWNFSTGAQIWRSDDGTIWQAANSAGFGDAHNEQIAAMTAFHDSLYIGTHNQVTGSQIWHTDDGREWTRIDPQGMTDEQNAEISSLISYRGLLYAGTKLKDGGSGVWRSSDGVNWSRVDSWLGTGELAYLVDHEGTLFMGTTGEQGAEVWSSSDGVHWLQRNDPGFGNAGNGSTLTAITFDRALYVGTSNPDRGADIYRTTGHGASVSIIDGDGSACAGQSYSYDIQVQNAGQYPLTQVTIVNGLPVGAIFLSHLSTPDADETRLTGSVIWDIGTLLPEERRSVHVEIQISTLVADGTLLVNAITAAAQEIRPLATDERVTVAHCAPRTPQATAQSGHPNTPSPVSGAATTTAATPDERPTQGAPTPAGEALPSQVGVGDSIRLPMILKAFVPG